ncbi:CRISPR-associated helicase Cas3' [Candidatus Bipolaricaulota bacterium]|nr:CRISPR-associated helicase Cas3' [Candidatus Bipolaricaulota bacterium]
MELIEFLRAKSSDQENYLLKDHLKETVARIIEMHRFFEDNKENFSYNLSEDLLEKLIVAAIIHDLGKIDYNFQKKVFKAEERESNEWIELKEFFRPLKVIQRSPRHEIFSSIWSTFLMGNDELDKKIRTAILLHHYNEYFVTERDLMEIIYDYEDQVKSYLEFIIENSSVLEDFLIQLLRYIQEGLPNDILSSAINTLRTQMDFGKAEVLLEKIKGHDDDISSFAQFYNPRVEDHDFLVLLGLLRRSDYSASANVPVELYGPRVFVNVENKIERKIPEKRLWQKELLDKIDFDDSIVLVAPTGSGKTELAILWSARNKRKLIYTLPLRVALNDLFTRFRNEEDGYFNTSDVDILHSTAFIEYMDEEMAGKSINVDKMMTSARLLSSPVLLTTPDQVFLTSLNYYGSDKVISIYPFSSFIIDEVQTYNEEMAAIIIKTVNMIRELGGKVMIMTATFPPYFEKFFKDFNFVDVKDYGLDIKNLDLKRHKIKVIDKPLFVEIDNELEIPEESINKIKRIIDCDKNLFIVVNNVRKAIELYERLREDHSNVYLLHSRILEIEKDRRLSEIKEKVENKERVIVVSTQIIEASVDLDFDVMITEISTIDSQIQRWGRIYRNRSKDYQEDEPNIIIFAGELENGNLKIDSGTRRIYDKKVVEKTREVLKEYEGEIFDYKLERNLISEVFERRIGNLTLKEHYESKIENILKDLEYFSVEKKSQAQLLFRRIAGVKIVIPDLIIQDHDNIRKIFGKCIKEGVKTWKEIIKKIKEDTGEEVDIWTLKKLLYEYSINMPIYYEEKSDFWGKTIGEFKGFYIWGHLSEDDLNSIKELGLDSIFKGTDSTLIL